MTKAGKEPSKEEIQEALQQKVEEMEFKEALRDEPTSRYLLLGQIMKMSQLLERIAAAMERQAELLGSEQSSEEDED